MGTGVIVCEIREMDKIPTLIVTIPDSDPTTFELSGERVGLGREIDNQIQVDVGAVSSCHCEFRKTPTGIEIVDLKSTNGTRVNGKKIESHTLVDGDRLLLGETVGAHYVELAEGGSVKPAAIAGGAEENKAAAAYTKMDEKLQSITADIVAKEAEHQKIAASLAKMREEFEAKKKERDTLLASMKSLEEQIAAKRAASGEGAQKEVACLEKELMLQTRRVQVLASDIDGQRQQMQQLESAAPAPPTKPGGGPIRVATMVPPSGGERSAPPLPSAQPVPQAPPAAAPPTPIRPAPMAPPQRPAAATAVPVPPPPAAPPQAPAATPAPIAPPQSAPKAIPIPAEIAQPAPSAKTVMLPQTPTPARPALATPQSKPTGPKTVIPNGNTPASPSEKLLADGAEPAPQKPAQGA